MDEGKAFVVRLVKGRENKLKRVNGQSYLYVFERG